jgi:hypothetical protein
MKTARVIDLTLRYEIDYIFSASAPRDQRYRAVDRVTGRSGYGVTPNDALLSMLETIAKEAAGNGDARHH